MLLRDKKERESEEDMDDQSQLVSSSGDTGNRKGGYGCVRLKGAHNKDLKQGPKTSTLTHSERWDYGTRGWGKVQEIGWVSRA